MIYLLFFIVAVISGYIGFINYRDTHRYTYSHYEIKSPKIKRPITFVLISDLHSQSYGKDNDKLIKAILSVNPYFVLSAGDLYTSSRRASIEPALALLKGLAERVPVIMSEGNHESKTRIEPDTYKGRYEDYLGRLDEISSGSKGITHLVNETCFIDGPEFAVSGFSLENKYFRRFTHAPLHKDYIRERLGDINPDAFNIMLAHNPLYFPEYCEYGPDLVLAGHIHGGVVRLPSVGGVLCPDYSLFPKYDAGLFREGDTTMIVSRGLGSHTLPIRLWNPADIPVITLMPEDV